MYMWYTAYLLSHISYSNSIIVILTLLCELQYFFKGVTRLQELYLDFSGRLSFTVESCTNKGFFLLFSGIFLYGIFLGKYRSLLWEINGLNHDSPCDHLNSNQARYLCTTTHHLLCDVYNLQYRKQVD